AESPELDFTPFPYPALTRDFFGVGSHKKKKKKFGGVTGNVLHAVSISSIDSRLLWGGVPQEKKVGGVTGIGLHAASLYVDDLQISCEGSDMRLIERQLQTAVNNIVKWCDINGHSISASKSCCVHFCRKRVIHPDPEIRIRAVQIPVVPDVPFLGVIFDRRLTFLPHILYLRKRCEKSLNILKVLSNTSWGADRTSLLRVYQAIVLSRIEYGCVVYTDQRATLL
ncbi:putative RNA-directed DNA polymerase from transposon X-element, partial [Trichonephila clavipes]